MPHPISRVLPGLALSAVLLPLAAAPAGAAAAPAKAGEPAVIEIRMRRPDPAVVARERERIRRALPGWCASYRAAMRPLRAALDETDESLAMAWGPWSRNVCFALSLELDAFTRRPLPPAPDPAVEAHRRRAISLLTEATTACLGGLPTTTRLHLQPALQELARTDGSCLAENPRRTSRLPTEPR